MIALKTLRCLSFLIFFFIAACESAQPTATAVPSPVATSTATPLPTMTPSPTPAPVWTNHGPFGGYVRGIVMGPRDSSVLYANTFGRGVFKSIDAGEHWLARNTGLPNLVIDALAIDPVRPSVLYASGEQGPQTESGLYKAIDGGNSWRAVNVGNKAGPQRIIANPNP
jgi:hypothetical protein